MKIFTFLGLLLLSTAVYAQTTQLKAADCGSTLTSFGQIFSVDGVAGATAYEFTFEDQSTSVQTVYVRNYHTMTLSLAGLFDVGAVYDVTVKAQVGGVFGAVGNLCTLGAPVGTPACSVVASSCGITLPNFTTAIYCTNVAGASSYKFRFTNTSTNVVTESSTNWIWNSLANASLFDIGASYEVRVAAIVNGTQGTYGLASCIVNAPASVPATELRTVDCGATMATFNQTFKCNSVANAVEYRFEFNNGGTITTVISPYTSLSFIGASLLDINVTYDVRVAAKIGATFGAYGPVCQLSSPALIPFTQLQTADCGALMNTYSQIFKADAVAGATLYEFEFTNVSTNVVTTATNSTRGMTLTAANLQIPNAEYDVRVRTTIGGTQSAYGIACTIFAPATVPLTKVSAAFCPFQTAAFADAFTCDAVQTATEYEWQFTDATTNNNPSPQVVTNIVTGSTTNSFVTAGITDPNRTYNVKVRAKVGGVYGNFGLPCFISTPITIPLVQLNATNSCGQTMANYTQIFKSTGGAGATDYEFKFVDVTIPGNPNPPTKLQIRGHFTNTLALAQLIEVGKTYDVTIRIKVGGLWGNFGPVCQLFSPTAVPTTSIKPIYCGTTLANFDSFIYAFGISGVDEYEFRYTNTSTLAQLSHLRTYWNSNLNMAGVTDINTVFDVDVRARVGTTWGAYAAVCSVTSPAVFNSPINNGNNTNATKSGAISTGNSTAVLAEVSVYPNPANNFVNIQANVSDYNAVIYDLNGKIIFTVNNANGLTNVSLEDIAEGLYVVMISDNTGNVIKTEKISVVK